MVSEGVLLGCAELRGAEARPCAVLLAAGNGPAVAPALCCPAAAVSCCCVTVLGARCCSWVALGRGEM